MNALRIFSVPRVAFAVVIAIAAAVAITATDKIVPLRSLQTSLMSRVDLAMAPASSGQDSRISVVTIDEATMAQLPYRSPIDRDMLAQIIRILTDAGAKAIGLDILFDQRTEDTKDAALIAAIQSFPGPTVIAWADSRAGMTKKQFAWLTEFQKASGAVFGFANLTTDPDGFIRNHSRGLFGTKIQSIAAALTGMSGPTGGGANWTIDWRMPVADGGSAFQTTPAHVVSLLQNNKTILEKWFRNRIVIIGVDLPLQDRHLTPLSNFVGESGTAGVLIHAHLIAQILDDRLAPMASFSAEVLVVLLVGLIAYLLATTRWAVAFKVAAIALLGIAYLAAVAAFAKAGGPVLPMVSPLLAIMFSTAGAMGTDAVRAHRERRFIRNAFSHYLAPQLVEELVSNPDMLRLGGERREMSILFTDIAGFTGMSEALKPEELSELLNEYLEGVSDIVMNHHGVIDKFIGDAVVGLFGVPGAEPGHAAQALECAMAIDKFAEAFRKTRSSMGLGETRIGVHTGIATVGNFGGRSRFDYTAIGDAMNTTARLESSNRAFGTRIAVSGDCLVAAEPYLQSPLPLQPIGDVVLKGKQETIFVATIRRDISAEWLTQYRQAFDALEKQP